jgi:hypothetical protein
MILPDEMSDDGIAVSDMLALVDDIGQLAARGGFRRRKRAPAEKPN